MTVSECGYNREASRQLHKHIWGHVNSWTNVCCIHFECTVVKEHGVVYVVIVTLAVCHDQKCRIHHHQVQQFSIVSYQIVTVRNRWSSKVCGKKEMSSPSKVCTTNITLCLNRESLISALTLFVLIYLNLSDFQSWIFKCVQTVSDYCYSFTCYSAITGKSKALFTDSVRAECLSHRSVMRQPCIACVILWTPSSRSNLTFKLAQLEKCFAIKL